MQLSQFAVSQTLIAAQPNPVVAPATPGGLTSGSTRSGRPYLNLVVQPPVVPPAQPDPAATGASTGGSTRSGRPYLQS